MDILPVMSADRKKQRNSEPDWDNLAFHIKERIGPTKRGGLGWNWKEFEAEAGISGTMRYGLLIGRYQKLTPETASKIDTALGWTSGSAKACLEGGKPQLAKPSKSSRTTPLRARQEAEPVDTEDEDTTDTNTSPVPEKAMNSGDTPVELFEIFRWWSRKVDTRFTREDMGQLVADFISLLPPGPEETIPVGIFQSWAQRSGKVFTRDDLGKLVQDVVALSSGRPPQ